MKKNIFKTLTFIAVIAMMASCNQQPSKMDGENTESDEPTALRIAYVDVDSLINNYEYAKVMNDSLEKMSANATSVLNNKDKELERSYNSIQTKLQNNGFTSEQQYKTAVAAFESERNNRVALEARLSNELMQKQADFTKTLHDSVNSFLNIYNIDKKYDIILRTGVANEVILYADKKFDITQDVINGLNQRYKK
ncbi:MAG: OmpH family outer membrane protein [Prevotella sp.]|nr:OmpH family outer membrane protein [Prevotella sp.]